jgi:hypothetical protein
VRDTGELLMRRILHKLRRRGIVLAAVAVVAAILAAVASAFVTTNGSASGSGSTGTLQAVTVTAFTGGDTPSSSLLPGGSADVILRINNPNSYPVTLISVTGGPGSVTADANHGACIPSSVTFNDQTGLGTSIVASGTTLVDLPSAASMSTSAPNGCQGATFAIPVTITVHKG